MFALAVPKTFWGVCYFSVSHPRCKWLSLLTLVISRSKKCYSFVT